MYAPTFTSPLEGAFLAEAHYLYKTNTQKWHHDGCPNQIQHPKHKPHMSDIVMPSLDMQYLNIMLNYLVWTLLLYHRFCNVGEKWKVFMIFTKII